MGFLRQPSDRSGHPSFIVSTRRWRAAQGAAAARVRLGRRWSYHGRHASPGLRVGERPHRRLGTARTIGELAGAVVLVVLFLLNEQRHPNPLVPLSLFKIKGLGEADVTQILAMAGFYTMFFLVTLYMQEVLRYSAIHTGLCYLPLTVGIGIGASVATNAIPKIGTRPLIAAGALLGAGGVFWLSRVPVHGTYVADLLPGMMIMGAAWASCWWACKMPPTGVSRPTSLDSPRR